MRNKAIHWLSGASVLIMLMAGGSAVAQDAAPNDAQIAAIVVTANQVDIDTGKVAERKASNKEVKGFAKRMVTDHTGSNKSAMDLATKLRLKPEESATSNSLKSSGDEMRKKLEDLKGADFDKAYIDNEVTYHQTVLDAIDKTLIPNAKNADLKSLLMKTRPVIADHLEHAKQVQSSLGKMKS